MVHVIATIDCHRGRRAALLAEFRQIVPVVRAEDGCLAYGAAVDLATGLAAQPPIRPDVAVVVEQWRDLPALEAHLAAPHMAAYRLRVKDLVIQTTLQVLAPAAE